MINSLTTLLKTYKTKTVFKLENSMKVVSSLKTIKNRDKDCRLIRRRGRIYIINKKNPRFKARQG